MASGGSSGRNSSGPRSFDFGSDDVLCSYDDFSHQDLSNGNRSDPSAKDFHESRVGRPLGSIYGQQDAHPKEEIIDAVEKCMKKYADNLLRHLEGISGRLSQLEIYCYKLERSIGEFRADMIRDQSDTDTKLKSLEKHLQEVHRSIQILRDKQELAETQKELTKLQVAPKESSAQSQKIDDTVAPSSISEDQRHNDEPEIPNHHLALALPHQIPQPTPLPARAPDQNQLPMPQQQAAPHDRYALHQPVQYYPKQSQPLQPELHYIQLRPQIQDPTQAAPPPHQNQVVSQAQTPNSHTQYMQQWSQPAPVPQQGMASTQQPASHTQLARPQTPSTYLSYSHQPANPETFGYATVAQSSGNHPDALSFGYPQQQGSSQTSFAPPPPKASGYMSTSPYPPQSNMQGYNAVYSTDGSRVQTDQPGSYLPPGSIQGVQNHQLHPNSNSGFRHPGQMQNHQLHPNSNSGFRHPGQMRAHPYADMIEKAASMGFPRDHVAGVVNRMAESGQPVDFNALLDSLNSRPPSAGPSRAWSG